MDNASVQAISNDDGAMNIPTSPRVSVVMAAYNYGQYIAQAIQSVLDQTFKDWELIIVDDGSTDDTPDVVRPFLSDSRVRYIRQENRGQPKTKNRGIELARGEFVAFLDADDAWLPEKLEKQLPLFAGHPEVGVTYTGLRTMDERGRLSESISCKRLRGDVLQECLGDTIPPFSSSIVRKKVFDEVGTFNEAIPLAIDYELWFRVAMHYQFDFVDGPLLLYRTGHANLTKQSPKRRRLVIDYILPHVLNECGGRERLTRKEIAEGYARLFIGMGECDMEHSQRSSLQWYLHALMSAPWMWSCWRGLIRSAIPNPIVRVVKRSLGQPR